MGLNRNSAQTPVPRNIKAVSARILFLMVTLEVQPVLLNVWSIGGPAKARKNDSATVDGIIIEPQWTHPPAPLPLFSMLVSTSMR